MRVYGFFIHLCVAENSVIFPLDMHESITRDLGVNGIRARERFKMSDLPSIPAELEERVRAHKVDWIKGTTTLLNMTFYDSRTPECKAFLSELFSSDLADEMVVVDMYPACTPNPNDGVRYATLELPRVVVDIGSIIAESNLCVKVEDLRHMIFTARMAPVRLAVPFVLSTYMNPPANTSEGRLASGSYVRSMSLWFKDWHIRAHLFRE